MAIVTLISNKALALDSITLKRQLLEDSSFRDKFIDFVKESMTQEYDGRFAMNDDDKNQIFEVINAYEEEGSIDFDDFVDQLVAMAGISEGQPRNGGDEGKSLRKFEKGVKSDQFQQ